MLIKRFISLWTCFSVHILYAHERKPLNTPIAICGAMFEFEARLKLAVVEHPLDLILFCFSIRHGHLGELQQ